MGEKEAPITLQLSTPGVYAFETYEGAHGLTIQERAGDTAVAPGNDLLLTVTVIPQLAWSAVASVRLSCVRSGAVEINAGAAATACALTEVAARPEVVWSLLVDVSRWPDWNPQIRSAVLDGPLVQEAVLALTFRLRPGTLSSRIREVEPCRRIGWTGTVFGTDTVHVFELESIGERTRVRSEASWDGLLVRLLRRPLGAMMRKANEATLGCLKLEAERIGGSDRPVSFAMGLGSEAQ